MKQKIGLVVLTKKTDYTKGNPRWECVQHTIDSFLDVESDYDFKVFVCGNGVADFIGDDCPLPEVYERGRYIERGGWNTQVAVQDGLDAAKEEGCDYSIVIKAGFTVSDLDFMDNKQLTIQCYIDKEFDHKNKLVGSQFMYGKTRTLNRIWINRPFDKTVSDQENLYKNVCNVVGIEYFKEAKKLDFLNSQELHLKIKAGGIRKHD